MGRLVGPLNPTTGFHGAGPVPRGFDIRLVMTLRAPASSSRVSFGPGLNTKAASSCGA